MKSHDDDFDGSLPRSLRTAVMDIRNASPSPKAVAVFLERLADNGPPSVAERPAPMNPERGFKTVQGFQEGAVGKRRHVLRVAGIIFALSLLILSGQLSFDQNVHAAPGLARVVNAVRHFDTMSFTQIDDAERTNAAGQQIQFKRKALVKLSAPSHRRTEYADGAIDVIDIRTGKALCLLANKSARLTDIPPLDENVIESFLTLAGISPTVKHGYRVTSSRSLDASIVNGHEAIGFEHCLSGIRENEGAGARAIVRVDQATNLPVYIEISFSHSLHPGISKTLVLKDFEFGTEFSSSLFELRVPDGYSLLEEGR